MVLLEYAGSGRGEKTEARFFATEFKAAEYLLKEEKRILEELKSNIPFPPRPGEIESQEQQIKAAEEQVRYLQEHPEEGQRPFAKKDK